MKQLKSLPDKRKCIFLCMSTQAQHAFYVRMELYIIFNANTQFQICLILTFEIFEEIVECVYTKLLYIIGKCMYVGRVRFVLYLLLIPMQQRTHVLCAFPISLSINQ